MNRDIQHLREDYKYGHLMEDQVPSNPIELFHKWFNDAQLANLPEPNAMTIATVNKEGKPSARIVLLKEFSKDGFTFYSNYDSRKGQDLISNPFIAVVFLWIEIERQVRIEGTVSKLPESKSTQYFHTRPKGSQIGAWASPQSQVITDRSILEDEHKRLTGQYKDAETLPKPPNWGGYIIEPTMIEFWQGRSSRLHDRLRYDLRDERWQIERLAP